MPDTENKKPTLFLENARLLFRNFGGLERQFNSEGDRNFNVVIEPKLAKALIGEGWRVKQLKPREEGEEGDYVLKVNLNYKGHRPPRVLLKSSGGTTPLDAGDPKDPNKPDTVKMLDAIEIADAKLFINGSWNDMAGGGYSAYLKTAVITMTEDPLEQEYAQEFMQDAKVGVLEEEPAF